MKNVLLLLLLLFVPTIQSFAQKTQPDSIIFKTKLAIADAKHFKSNKQIRIAHRKRLLLNSSDYFLPVASKVKNQKLLTDSVYVKAYKNAAYNKSIHNGKTGYYAVVAAEFTGVVIAMGALLYLLIRALFRSIDIK